MTTPTPVAEPSKAKAWTALVGSALSVVIPLILQVSQFLPPPYPALIGGAIALLTAIGVYKAPYLPPGATVAPPAPAGPPAAEGDPWQ